MIARSPLEIRKVAVLGAGLMGHGIAQVAAQVGGYDVVVRDVEERFIDNGERMIKESLSRFVKKSVLKEDEATDTFGRIRFTLSLGEAVGDADLIIEAVTEEESLKTNLLREVSEKAPSHSVIASNTSSISITLLGSATKRPEEVCGMHFFNPPQLMKLVEIIRGAKTSDQTVKTIESVAKRMGKETVIVKKDSPGFIVNRILVPALNEAIYLIHEGVATPEDVDKAMKLGLNWPMGPFTLLDYVGLDTTLSIIDVFLREFQDSKYRPCPLLKQMVRGGLLGRKSGRGFYDWSKGPPEV